MGATRSLLLAAAQNRWLKEHAPRFAFVRKSVSRFMPGETLEDALGACRRMREAGIASAVSHLGENTSDVWEAEAATRHYLTALEKTQKEHLETELSVKLTQLGLDLSPELCERNLRRLLERESLARTLWIDMEGSNYVE